jgi:cytochrome oxidase Cu insertion factor (SCO1/SenC/PrrC family)
MRNTRRRASVRYFNIAMVAAPVVAALGFLFWLGVIAPRASREIMQAFRVRAGEPVPSVTLADTLGTRSTLAEALAGGPALVVVMNPTCAHCHTELESIRAIQARTPAPRRSRVVVVSVGESERLREAARRYPEFPVYDDVAGAIQNRLGLKMVPANFSVGADGRVTDVRVGLQSEPYLTDALASLSR